MPFCLYQTSGFVFTPTDQEKSSKVLHLRYNSTKDQYCRVSNNSEVIKGWDQCVWTTESVFRKVENDWEMVCLILLHYVLPVKFCAVFYINCGSQDTWLKMMQVRGIDLLDYLIAGLYNWYIQYMIIKVSFPTSGVFSSNWRLIIGENQLEDGLCSSWTEDKVCLSHGQ